ncbi:MAG TPA: 5-formyltetrahydrofolate cyclo-ligase [Burkholderiaceae bacterium]|nr:5-formyltetrahydrofolate cyclo-ligase [Burkholderiaceae bacterium]
MNQDTIAMNDSPQPDLTALRQHLKDQRAGQSPTDTSRGALLIRGRLFTWLATRQSNREEQGKPRLQNIAAFWSLPEEPALQPLLEQWVEEQGYTVSLPVVTGKDQPLSFRVWKPGDTLADGAFGIKEPTGEPAPAPDIMLVPVLGFTRQGHRIGYGGGHYDRTLAALRAQQTRVTCLGIAWAVGDLSGQTPPYQPAPHDQPLDGILTDKGWPMPAPDL